MQGDGVNNIKDLKNHMFETFLQKKYVIPAIVLAIMLGAFAVRFYNFHDWLYFKMDQSRDAFTISSAVTNGPGNLPLLGARAGATKVTYGFLHLGPVFYYFQYLSGVLFHSTAPDVFAYPDLFFGVMVLPLLYVFSRYYFKRYVSLLVIAMYAFSYIIIEYSRFAWNPNSLPFFTILSFLALLKFLNTTSDKKRALWVAIWAMGLAVGSQLHFVGFFCLIGVSGLLVIYHYQLWKKINLGKIFQKEILGKIFISLGIALMVFLIFYTPVIISDTMKNGANTRDFIEALSSKPVKKPLLDKLEKDINLQLRYYTMITTAYLYPKNMTTTGYAAIFFTLATFLGGLYLIAKKIIRGGLNQEKKDFLMVIFLWVSVFFILCIPLSYQLRPRFFIFTFAVPFILLGLIFEALEESRQKFYPVVIFILVATVIGGNVFGVRAWFQEQAASQTKYLAVKRTLILKAKDGVTLGQLEKAVDYMYASRQGDSRLYFYVKSEHVRPLEYLFSQKKDANLNYYSALKLDSGDPKAQYFAVVPSDCKESSLSAKIGINASFQVVSEKQFGQIAVWELVFPDRTILPDFKVKKSSSLGESDRLYWKDIFGGNK